MVVWRLWTWPINDWSNLSPSWTLLEWPGIGSWMAQTQNIEPRPNINAKRVRDTETETERQTNRERNIHDSKCIYVVKIAKVYLGPCQKLLEVLSQY